MPLSLPALFHQNIPIHTARPSSEFSHPQDDFIDILGVTGFSSLAKPWSQWTAQSPLLIWNVSTSGICSSPGPCLTAYPWDQAGVGSGSFFSQRPNLTRSPSLLGWAFFLTNKTWVYSSMCNKGNLLTAGCGEGEYSVYCKVPSKNRQVALKILDSPMGFKE